MPFRDPLPPGPFLLRSGRIEIRAGDAAQVCSALGIELAGRPVEVIDLVSGQVVPVARFLAMAPADGSTTAGLEDLLRTDGVEVASASTIAAMPAATPELRRPGIMIPAPPARTRAPSPAGGAAVSRRSRSSQQSPIRGQRGHLDERRPGSRFPWLGLILGGAGLVLVIACVLLIMRRPSSSRTVAQSSPETASRVMPLPPAARPAPTATVPSPAPPSGPVSLPSHPPGITVAAGSRATASFCWSTDTVAALNDGIVPTDSADQRVPRMTWYDHVGTAEWVQYDFARPALVHGVDVYWYQDRTGCYLPASWKVLYRDGEAWKPVQADGVGDLELDRFSHVDFAPVTTTALRLTVELQQGHSSGVLEWRVDGESAP
ncbi:MAG: discoidin domain-containing protein [Planctomycetes bacterium]|nr:discoidin domain-containing protein [Planctomycetota bacterium]